MCVETTTTKSIDGNQSGPIVFQRRILANVDGVWAQIQILSFLYFNSVRILG